ncbi:MAG TPA: helix-turn-helix domain-containing protein [Streptosporangiaceae bacterium]|nr:helix-turn-helix domain-containing protein [Streptosporangiaceae bacterium]
MPRVNARRPYSSPLRERQASTTRRAVLDAARELLIAQGYGATTVEQIAQRAGVSKPTVFSAVGNKQLVLRAVRDAAIAGDDEPVPVAKRPATDQIRGEPDQRAAVELLAQHLTGVARRYAQINEVLHAAADGGEEDLRQLWETEEDQRLTGARFWVEILTSKGPLRPGLSHGDAADVMWLLMSPDNYYRLVHRRRWTTRKYQQWLAAAITQLLFAGHP